MILVRSIYTLKQPETHAFVGPTLNFGDPQSNTLSVDQSISIPQSNSLQLCNKPTEHLAVDFGDLFSTFNRTFLFPDPNLIDTVPT